MPALLLSVREKISTSWATHRPKKTFGGAPVMSKKEIRLTTDHQKFSQGTGDSKAGFAVDTEFLTLQEAALLVRAVSIVRTIDGEFSDAEREKLKTLAKRINRLVSVGSEDRGIKGGDSAGN